MADMLDSLHVGLCLFDEEDRQLLWNRSFLRLFPEHVGHITTGEPYAANLRRFYLGRLDPSEWHTIERRVAAGIKRFHAQTAPFIFEHRGQWVRVAAEPVPGVGRLRIWTPIAPPDGTAALDPAADPQVMPFDADEGDGASLADSAGRITWVNPRFLRLFQLAVPADAIGRTHPQIFRSVWLRDPGDPEFRQWQVSLAEAERFTGAPFELPLPNGTWLRVLQQRRQNNTITSSFADITPMKRLEQKLEQARLAAEQANRAKDQFLATVSHELRTPMNGILGMLDLVDDGRLRPEQRERIGFARQSAEALLGLVDDILTFSRLEAGQIDVDHVSASPDTVLETVVRLMQPKAKQKGLALSWKLDPGVPAQVMCDPARLRQVLLNLIGNAVKFTEQGSVAVAMRCGGDLPDGRLQLEVTVSDTGIGIHAAALESIFEPFVQADAGIGRKYGGTGLGLAICRQLVEAMGGDLSVTSREGVGSTFRFRVACGRADAAIVVPVPTPPGARLPPLRALVVDDNSINREVARLNLEHLGLTVDTVRSGAEALAACATAYDLILMDLQMPDMDGYQTTQAIRGSGRPGAAAAIVALTAHAGDEHRERCTAAGMQGFIAKPIRQSALAAEIAAVIARNASRVTHAMPAPETALLDADAVQDWASVMSAPARRELIDVLEAQVRGAMTEIAAASGSGTPHAAAVHHVKGAAWNMGARSLGDLLQVVETLCPADARDRLPDLKRVADATLAALRDNRTLASGHPAMRAAEALGAPND